jgi:uncharacterized protein YbaR (Trm112 family)
MTPQLLDLLCDPVTHEPLALCDPEVDARGHINSGRLVAPSGASYPIIDGVPRFLPAPRLRESVAAFGEEWNTLNFVDFREHWLRHMVANTFGGVEVFAGKIILDAGAGSGAQTGWMLEAGAAHVIALELSPSVDGAMRKNLIASGSTDWDIVQCSIDQPPLRSNSIGGMVICHNVIQHTPSVERTARALFDLAAPGGEFVFNCYPVNDAGLFRWLRHHLMFRYYRSLLRHLPFSALLVYGHLMAMLRLLPGVGRGVELVGLCMQGDVPGPERGQARLRQRYRATLLNTVDWYGAHEFQHYTRENELRNLVRSLQPDEEKVLNLDRYFRRPPPIGCALRVQKGG